MQKSALITDDARHNMEVQDKLKDQIAALEARLQAQEKKHAAELEALKSVESPTMGGITNTSCKREGPLSWKCCTESSRRKPLKWAPRFRGLKLVRGE